MSTNLTQSPSEKKQVSESGPKYLRLAEPEMTVEYLGEQYALYRVVALRDIFDTDNRLVAKKGAYGGLVSSDNNLSQKGRCWLDCRSVAFGKSRVVDDATVINSLVGGEAFVGGSAQVRNNSFIYEKAAVSDRAIVDRSVIRGNAKVIDGAQVLDGSIIRERAEIKGHAICQRAFVSGSAVVCDGARLHFYVKVEDRAKIKGSAKVYLSQISGSAIVCDVSQVKYSFLGGDCYVGGIAALIASKKDTGRFTSGVTCYSVDDEVNSTDHDANTAASSESEDSDEPDGSDNPGHGDDAGGIRIFVFF